MAHIGTRPDGTGACACAEVLPQLQLPQDLYGQRPDPVRDARSAKKGEVSSHSGILLLDPITYNINQKKTPVYKYVYAQRCLAHARGGAR